MPRFGVANDFCILLSKISLKMRPKPAEVAYSSDKHGSIGSFIELTFDTKQ